MKQLSIYDKEYPDFRTLDREEVLKIVSEETGLIFEYNEQFDEYRCKKALARFGGVGTLTFNIGTYKRGEKQGQKCISVGFFCPLNARGFPVESIGEAIEFYIQTIGGVI